MQVDERIDRCPRRGYPARDITDAPETSLGIEVSATLTMSRLDVLTTDVGDGVVR